MIRKWRGSSQSRPPGENTAVRRLFSGMGVGLGLDGVFEPAMDEEAVEVPWSGVAAVLAINRLCAPGSELAIEERWYPSTALDDLLEIEKGKISDTRLYCCLDRILPHKTKLEQNLKQRYGELFGEHPAHGGTEVREGTADLCDGSWDRK
jgi:hypothetical protein